MDDDAPKHRNAIDQRNANPTNIECPVFWRQFGIPLSRFFAVYPWTMTILLVVVIFLPSRIARANAQIISLLFTIFGISYLLLFLPALAWYIFSFAAALRGVPKEVRKTANLFAWFFYAAVWYFGCRFLMILFWAN